MLRNDGPDGLSASPLGLRTGCGSGYMAIDLAVLGGARRVLLAAGYDNRPVAGRNHFFGDHPDGNRQPYKQWLERYRSMVKPLAALGVEVVNCTPGSAIDAFPAGELEHELARLVRDPAGAAVPA
jgi:hypothetical protein